MVFVACAFVQSQNLALNGTATASNNNQPASNAIDGNAGTRWETAFADPQWITIDLGTSYTIGQAAAIIRGYRKPEPYKGKGIKYTDEKIIRKAGKTSKK